MATPAAAGMVSRASYYSIPYYVDIHIYIYLTHYMYILTMHNMYKYSICIVIYIYNADLRLT